MRSGRERRARCPSERDDEARIGRFAPGRERQCLDLRFSFWELARRRTWEGITTSTDGSCVRTGLRKCLGA